MTKIRNRHRRSLWLPEEKSEITERAVGDSLSVALDFSTEFCCLVDQSLRNKPMLRPSNFERIVAKFGND